MAGEGIGAESRSGRLGRFALVATAALLVGSVATWAAMVVFAPPRAIDEVAYPTATVKVGKVESALNLNVAASWPSVATSNNQATGTVTTVNVAAGQTVAAGTTIYTVNLRPVVVGEGAVPAFRDIGLGAKGDDVAQAQKLLTAVGVYSGPADGDAGPSTVRAIRAFKMRLGLAPSDVLQAGDVIYVPRLPTRVLVDLSIAPGNTVSPGSPAVSVLPTEPSFTLTVSPGQASLIPDGASVSIHGATNTWPGVAAHREETKDGNVRIALAPTESGTICGKDCGELPATSDQLTFSSTVTLVPAREGAVVPLAAVRTTAEGASFVVDTNGRKHAIAILASANGMAAVRGLSVGAKVRLPLNTQAGQ